MAGTNDQNGTFDENTLPSADADSGMSSEMSDLWDEMDAAEQGANTAESEASPEEGHADDEEGGDHGEDAPSRAQDDHERDTAPEEARAPGRDREQQDEWASAPPELKPRIQKLVEERKAIGQENHRNRQTIGQLKAELAELRRVASPQAGAANGRGSNDASYLETDDAKRLQEDYPEIAGPIFKVIGSLEATVKGLERHVQSDVQRNEAAVLAEQDSLLREQHPDYETVIASNGDRFRAWLDTQPRHIREAAQRNAQQITDASEAADVVSRFKASIGMGAGARRETQEASPPSGKRQRQLLASSAPRSRSPATTGEIPEDGDPDAIWDAFEREEARKAAARR